MDHKFFLTAVTLALPALLAGCGGAPCSFGGCNNPGPQGGAGGGAGGLMIVDENSALPALREAWFAATTTAALPSFVIVTGVGEVIAGPVVVDPAGPTSYDCPVSGTFMVSGNVADPNTVTAGDFVSYESSVCDSSTGYVVDGVHSLDIVSIDGDVASGQFEQAQNLEFTDFQATSPTLATTVNGDHTAVIDTRALNTVTTSYSGTSLIVNEEQIAVTMRNYSGIASVQTIAPFNFLLDTAGRANSTNVSGSFDYRTDETIRQQLGANPFDGILEIFGLNGGTARIAVVDAAILDVQVDANGSTNYEISVNMTWDDFLNGTGVLQ